MTLNGLRLYVFNLFKGDITGLKVLAKELGWLNTLKMGAQLKWTLFYNNPFKHYNEGKQLSYNEKLSQHQMAPLIVLYRLLLNKGYDMNESLLICKKVSDTVATEFLRFSIPVIEKKTHESVSDDAAMNLLSRITGRFFNTESDLKLNGRESFSVTVNRCHFAHYAKALNIPELGPLFCDADKHYFDNYQPDVVFFRSQTLAKDQQPCDFKFSWKED